MKVRTSRKPPVPARPTPDSLHTAALAHLARYAATEAGLLRVLERRVQRWAHTASEEERQLAEGLRHAARELVARLAAAGAVSDAGFAEARTRTLQRSGKSGRAIGAHLAARGVARELVVPQDPAAEATAAALHMRRRRLGPFGQGVDSPEQRRRDLSSLARAGFSQDVARRALRLTRPEAEALIARFRAGL